LENLLKKKKKIKQKIFIVFCAESGWRATLLPLRHGRGPEVGGEAGQDQERGRLAGAAEGRDQGRASRGVPAEHSTKKTE
jgi:hypothetical protein